MPFTRSATTRRHFLGTTAATAVAGSLATPATGTVGNQPGPAGPRKRIAIITTLWAYLRHGQHIGDRFLVGYPWEGDWHEPEVEVVSAFVAQQPTEMDRKIRAKEFGFPQGDLSTLRAREFGFSLYKSIAEALRCGGKTLAVDGVVLIAEHGEYPTNSLGQKLYPRAEFFSEIVDVFRSDGRAVPVFNDKHLSYSFEKARAMCDASRELQFPLLAGSSLPVGWRMPEMEVPYGAKIEEALAISGSQSLDSAGFHALEALQCLVERRHGGESGIRRVQTLTGPDVWRALSRKKWSTDLMARALSRADLVEGVTLVDARPQDLAAPGVLESIVSQPQAVLFEYRDGLSATLLMLKGAVGDFTAAVRLDRGDRVLSTKFHLPVEPNVAYSACLAHHIETMIVTGQPGYPVERTLLVSGLLEAAHHSRSQQGRRLKTPQLDVRYQAPRASLYCRS
ncbi:MAG: twin-arginine translocation signal domain-containing protein [Planctomycetota bacterium]|nr:twin-arginine translocation signal domain-containing protein [Planctomycetota bacterium]